MVERAAQPSTSSSVSGQFFDSGRLYVTRESLAGDEWFLNES